MFYNYKFPEITHIDQIRAAVAGRDEFIEKDRGDHIIVDYAVNFEDTFPPTVRYSGATNLVIDEHAILRREIRGIAFDKESGLIIRRPPHKFFNLNEREETHFNRVEWNRVPFDVLLKEDGSCISVYRSNGRLIWGTPAGETDYSPMVESFVGANPHYHLFALYMVDLGWTPTFEFCSLKNRVVVEHPNDRLVLTCIRNNITGEYLPYDQLIEFKEIGIEVVQSFPVDHDNKNSVIEELIEVCGEASGYEGYIIRFHDGHMLKLKTEWYRALHGCVTGIRFEKDALKIILSNTLDDLKPFLHQDMAERMEQHAKDIDEGLRKTAREVVAVVEDGIDKGMSAKDFVAFCQKFVRKGVPWGPKLRNQDTTFPFMMELFNHYHETDLSPEDFVYTELRNFISKPERLTSQTWIDRLRFLYWDKSFNVYE